MTGIQVGGYRGISDISLKNIQFTDSSCDWKSKKKLQTALFQLEESSCIHLFPRRRKLRPCQDWLYKRNILFPPLSQSLSKTFSLDIYYFFFILFLLNFLANVTVCLPPELDNMTSEICYLEAAESPDLKYQNSHLRARSKCPAVPIERNFSTGKYSL